MRRTIHGRRFDTDRATKIGGADVSYSKWEGESSSRWCAGLYVTWRSRRFFLAGAGGFMSRFRGEEGIVELTKEEAAEWIEEYLGAEVFDDWKKKESAQ